jgi:uncharacterized protein YkwD
VARKRRAFNAANRRSLLGAVCALCLGACALGAVDAVAGGPQPARSASSRAGSPIHHKRGRKVHCAARRSSFHSVAVRPKGSAHKRHHRGRRASCHGRHRHYAKHHSATHRSPASHSSACPDSDLRPAPENLDAVRAATLCLINRERTGHGESPLALNDHLQQAAQGHSEDMAAGNYFEHNGRRGDTPLGRMRSAGYIFSSRVGFQVGENIGWGTLWLASPRAMVASWMASPGHRENILDGHFRDTGIGVSPHPLTSLAKGQAGAIYTQDFGVIITP